MRVVRGVPTDELDFRIVQQMVLGAQAAGITAPRTDRARVEELAAALHVHPNTVKARIRRLNDEDVLLPFSVQVQGPMVGLELVHVFFPVPAERRSDALRERVRRVPGLHYYMQYVEGWTLCLYGQTLQDVQRIVSELETLLHAEATWDLIASRDWPPSEAVLLDELDQRLIGLLVRDGRATPAALGRQLGVPPRTVRRRQTRLFADKVLRYTPGGSQRPLGMVRGYVRFQLDGGPGRQAAADRVSASLRDFFSGRVFATWGHFWLFGKDVAGMMAQVEPLRGVPGIRDVRARVMEDFEVIPAFAAWIVAALAKAQTRRMVVAH